MNNFEDGYEVFPPLKQFGIKVKIEFVGSEKPFLFPYLEIEPPKPSEEAQIGGP
jgi:hypothetical protein